MADEPAAKKSRMDEIPTHLTGISEEVKKALVDIDAVQSEIDAINEKASDEILKIEQKYNQLRSPHYEKRATFIKSIPNFWSTALLNHPQLSTVIEDNDMPLLQAITNLEVEEHDDIKRGFKIKICFGTNEFFDNEKIEKDFQLGENPSTTTTPIKWKEGKGVVKPDAGDEQEPFSFLQWLTESIDPSNDEVAEIIKDDLWPNPVQYFLCPDIEEVGDVYEDLGDDDEVLEEVDEDGSEGDN